VCALHTTQSTVRLVSSHVLTVSFCCSKIAELKLPCLSLCSLEVAELLAALVSRLTRELQASCLPTQEPMPASPFSTPCPSAEYHSRRQYQSPSQSQSAVTRLRAQQLLLLPCFRHAAAQTQQLQPSPCLLQHRGCPCHLPHTPGTPGDCNWRQADKVSAALGAAAR
jgi:hypothetical protein